MISRTTRRTSLAVLMALAFCAPAIANSTTNGHDAHKLSAAELQTFLPVVCKGAKKGDEGYDCAALPGYGANGAERSGKIDLWAVAYGSFTAPGADEAYLTYSGLEPHADNFGGGILLRRARGVWTPVRWVPGGQMDRCAAIPGAGTQKMLCLESWFGMGEGDSSIWVLALAGLDRGQSIDRENVLKAQDGRQASAPGSYCENALSGHRDLLVAIDNLVWSGDPGVLATSKIEYAPYADVQRACAKQEFSKLKTHTQTLRYRLVDGKIRTDPPHAFAEVDY